MFSFSNRILGAKVLQSESTNYDNILNLMILFLAFNILSKFTYFNMFFKVRRLTVLAID